MCTGEVEMKLWMRDCRAGLTASPARSMSLKPARARPHTTAFLVRLAISWTAAKSPSEATGKPASMMSTPMVSRSSATSSFSSWVMVAPGHCSPSRKVVSKMTTRSFAEFAGADLTGSGLTGGVMIQGPSRLRPPLSGQGARGFRGFGPPLSAQAPTPRRPSGGAKQQEPAENEGSTGRGLHGLPGHRAEIAARRHCQTLVAAQRSRIKVNSALTQCEAGLLVAEDQGDAQDGATSPP